MVLPLLLSLAGIGVLRATAGPRRAGAAVGLAVIAPIIWMAGWSTAPGSLMERLPWIIAAAWVVGVVLEARSVGRILQWLILTIVWIASSTWLGSPAAAQAIAWSLGGAAVIALLLHGPGDRGDAAAMAVFASLGLAGLAFSAASLALFQFSLALAAASAGAALWQWPRPRIRFGSAAVAVVSIAWLALAQSMSLLLPVQPGALGILALAYAAALLCAPLTSRSSLKSRPAVAPLAVAIVAAACVAGAMAVQGGGANDDAGANSHRSQDDAYYPR